MTTGAAVTSVGMCSALGDSALATTAAIRARLSRFREWREYPCLPADPPREGGTQLLTAAYTDVPRGDDLLKRLLARALQDLVSFSDLVREDLEEASFWLALPPRDAASGPAWASDLAARSGLEALESARVVRGSSTSMLALLAAAAQEISKKPETAILIAGAGSHLHFETLSDLDRNGRLKSFRNLDGFIPGEGASAVLVEGRRRAEARGASILADIESFGTAAEPRPITSGDPPTGQALAAAIEQACSVGGPATWVVCDLNGESYRAKEFALARVHARGLFGDLRKVWHPADGFGDLGPATGGALVSLCAAAWSRGVAPEPRALLFAGDDDGARVAVTLVGPAPRME